MIRVLDLQTYDAYTNMAIDEAIFQLVQEDKSLNTIRFYKWKPNAITIGANQDLNDIDLELAKQNRIDIVRRITGGRAVYHDGEKDLTYSIITKTKTNISYEKICNEIIEALNMLKIKATLGNSGDILVKNKKISGNAQIIKNGTVLQHGTLLWKKPDYKLSSKLLKTKESNLKKQVTSIEEFDKDITESKTIIFLQNAFLFNKIFKFSNLTKKEIKLTKKLIPKYKRLEKENTCKKGACYLIH